MVTSTDVIITAKPGVTHLWMLLDSCEWKISCIKMTVVFIALRITVQIYVLDEPRVR